MDLWDKAYRTVLERLEKEGWLFPMTASRLASSG